jgi:hypothetical protein
VIHGSAISKLEEGECVLLWINDDFIVRELEFYKCFKLSIFREYIYTTF